jgi:hypothetical protein
MTDGEWQEIQKKPVTVEYRGPYETPEGIETIEGDFQVSEEYIEEHGGFVIIKGVDGEVYPCALDIFNETYEEPNETDSFWWHQYGRYNQIVSFGFVYMLFYWLGAIGVFFDYIYEFGWGYLILLAICLALTINWFTERQELQVWLGENE